MDELTVLKRQFELDKREFEIEQREKRSLLTEQQREITKQQNALEEQKKDFQLQQNFHRDLHQRDIEFRQQQYDFQQLQNKELKDDLERQRDDLVQQQKEMAQQQTKLKLKQKSLKAQKKSLKAQQESLDDQLQDLEAREKSLLQVVQDFNTHQKEYYDLVKPVGPDIVEQQERQNQAESQQPIIHSFTNVPPLNVPEASPIQEYIDNLIHAYNYHSNPVPKELKKVARQLVVRDEELNAREEDLTEREIKAIARQNGMLNVFVKTIFGHTVVVQVSSTDDISYLRQLVALATIPPRSLRFEGKLLEDGKKVGDYGIGEDSTMIEILTNKVIKDEVIKEPSDDAIEPDW